MIRFIKKLLSGQKCYLPLVLVAIVAFQLVGCQDSGSVGADVGDPIADLNIDTLEVTGFQTQPLEAYTGNLGFFSAGQFQDPHFGNITARALIKPRLAPNGGTSFFDQDTEMQLRLVFNQEAIYGDSLASMQFDLVEVAELWRGPAWRINDEVDLVEGATVASFSVAGEDSIDIPLSTEWKEKYGDFYDRSGDNRDSLYARQFFGLALVPQNSGKIIPINSTESNFIATEVESATANDFDLTIALNNAAFSVDRNGTASNAGSFNLFSTYEQIINFDYDFSTENLGSSAIAKAELVIYRDNLVLEESINQAGPNAVRPDPSFLKLHLLEGDELPQSLNQPVGAGQQPFPVAGVYREKDEAYHFLLTDRINAGILENLRDSLRFYITQGNKDGIIRSNVLFNGADGSKSPKLIITYTNNN